MTTLCRIVRCMSPQRPSTSVRRAAAIFPEPKADRTRRGHRENGVHDPSEKFESVVHLLSMRGPSALVHVGRAGVAGPTDHVTRHAGMGECHRPRRPPAAHNDSADTTTRTLPLQPGLTAIALTWQYDLRPQPGGQVAQSHITAVRTNDRAGNRQACTPGPLSRCCASAPCARTGQTPSRADLASDPHLRHQS